MAARVRSCSDDDLALRLGAGPMRARRCAAQRLAERDPTRARKIIAGCDSLSRAQREELLVLAGDDAAVMALYRSPGFDRARVPPAAMARLFRRLLLRLADMDAGDEALLRATGVTFTEPHCFRDPVAGARVVQVGDGAVLAAFQELRWAIVRAPNLSAELRHAVGASLLNGIETAREMLTPGPLSRHVVPPALEWKARAILHDRLPPERLLALARAVLDDGAVILAGWPATLSLLEGAEVATVLSDRAEAALRFAAWLVVPAAVPFLLAHADVLDDRVLASVLALVEPDERASLLREHWGRAGLREAALLHRFDIDVDLLLASLAGSDDVAWFSVFDLLLRHREARGRDEALGLLGAALVRGDDGNTVHKALNAMGRAGVSVSAAFATLIDSGCYDRDIQALVHAAEKHAGRKKMIPVFERARQRKSVVDVACVEAALSRLKG